MSDHDLFGLERETKIIKSGVRNIFTPHHPVKLAELLFGREDNVRRIIESFNKPGQSVLLYGERGVGKTSIASVVPRISTSINPVEKIIYKTCTSEDTFDSIFQFLFEHAGIDRPKTLQKKHERAISAKAKIPFAEGGGESARTDTKLYEFGNISASEIVNSFKDKKIIFVVDEFDAVQNIKDKHRMSEAIKLISDAAIDLKMLVVGISNTGFDLFAGHPSAQRCLRGILLNKMTDAELMAIIKGGAKKLKIVFEDKILKKIINLSDGFPHFTQLIALKCAEEAIVLNADTINQTIFDKAQHAAAEESETVLKRWYQDAIRSQTASDTYKFILLAAARCAKNEKEFRPDALRTEYKMLTGEDMSQGELNNFLPKLISEGPDTILKRLAKGVYCFNDPRMPSFIRIVNHTHDI